MAREAVKISESLCSMLSGMCVTMFLLILLFPGALFFRCCKALFMSANVIGCDSGLLLSKSVSVFMWVVGVMR